MLMFPLWLSMRNTVIRPPVPWVEPLTALAFALICFDVNRKVSWVPEGSWSDGVCGFGLFVCVCVYWGGGCWLPEMLL